MPAGTTLTLPDGFTELAAYIVRGDIRAAGDDHGKGIMIVARSGDELTLEAISDARVMVLGGESVGPRHIWWNFVSNSKERIEAAKEQWRDGKFGRVEGDSEFIPLPDV
jgi:redox-sensitive bicupin YhaK (pirin superfamily)